MLPDGPSFGRKARDSASETFVRETSSTPRSGVRWRDVWAVDIPNPYGIGLNLYRHQNGSKLARPEGADLYNALHARGTRERGYATIAHIMRIFLLPLR